MKIETYISQLLYRYHCVTVPNFGAFLTEIESAKIDENGTAFFPPKKIVSFNSYLKNNDGLLANHISQVEKISYDEALGYVKLQVQSWRERLDLYGAITVKNVGEFTVSIENKILFKPFEQLNYLTDSFGLNTLNLAEITRQVDQNANQIQVETALNVPKIANEQPKLLENNEIQVISLPLKRHNFVKYAAVFAIALGAATLYGYNFYENKIAHETLLVQKKVQKQITQKIQEATFLIEIPVADVILTLSTDKLPFHIVAGAFRNKENADKELQKLLRLGYDARQIEKNESGLYPVVYGSYATYVKAHEEMAKIKKNNSAAWVLIEE